MGSAVKGLLGGKAGGSIVGADPAQMQTAYDQTQAGIKQQQDFVNALTAQNGIQNQSQVYNQLQGMVNGTGPNAAQTMLNNSTGQNVANQAALMAGQRGASANPALIARQAAMQGANTQQQAVGQGAALQAQQSQNALNSAAGLATNQVGQQQTGLQNLNQDSLQQQSNILGLQQNANNANAGLAQGQQTGQFNLLGNLTGALGSSLIPKAKAEGGFITMADGGAVTAPVDIPHVPVRVPTPGNGPQSNVGKHLVGIMMAQGGKVRALVSPGEVYLKPEEAKEVAKGKKSPMAGEKIPGKPKVAGAKNSYANDTVPKELDEGGIVIPRSVTQGKDAEKKAAEFVKAIFAKKSLPKRK